MRHHHVIFLLGWVGAFKRVALLCQVAANLFYQNTVFQIIALRIGLWEKQRAGEVIVKHQGRWASFLAKRIRTTWKLVMVAVLSLNCNMSLNNILKFLYRFFDRSYCIIILPKAWKIFLNYFPELMMILSHRCHLLRIGITLLAQPTNKFAYQRIVNVVAALL